MENYSYFDYLDENIYSSDEEIERVFNEYNIGVKYHKSLEDFKYDIDQVWKEIERNCDVYDDDRYEDYDDYDEEDEEEW